MSDFKTFSSRASAPRPEEQWVPVTLNREKETAGSVALQDFNGMTLHIDRSLLEDNHLQIEQHDFIRLPESLYRHWFGTAKQALQEKKEQWEWLLYEEHIPLFWRHRQRIFEEPKLYSAQLPRSPYNYNFMQIKPPTLGMVVEAWLTDPQQYTLTCPECGEPMVIYHHLRFLSTGITSCCCTHCQHRICCSKTIDVYELATPLHKIISGWAALERSLPRQTSLDEVVHTLKNMD